MLVSFTDGVPDLYGGTLTALGDIADLVKRHPEPVALTQAFSALAPAGKREDDITVVALRRAT